MLYQLSYHRVRAKLPATSRHVKTFSRQMLRRRSRVG